MSEILPTPAQQFSDAARTVQCPCGEWFETHANATTKYCAECRKLPYSQRPQFERVCDMFPHRYFWRLNDQIGETRSHHAKKGR